MDVSVLTGQMMITLNLHSKQISVEMLISEKKEDETLNYLLTHK